MRDEPLVVGSAYAAYLVCRCFLDTQLPALITGLATAALAGRLGELPSRISSPVSLVTARYRHGHSVLVVVITLQSNPPSVVFLRSQIYDPPECVINTIRGVVTLVGSLLRPIGRPHSLPAMSLLAGLDAGGHQLG